MPLRLALPLLIAHAALACTCGPFEDLPTALNRSTLVFTGTVEYTDFNLGLLITDEVFARMGGSERAGQVRRDEPAIVRSVQQRAAASIPVEFRARLAAAHTLDQLHSLASVIERRGYTTRLRLLQAWKGEPRPTVEIWQGSSTGCVVDFRPGDAYLLFASPVAYGGSEGQFGLRPCSRNSLLRNVASDLVYLHLLQHQPHAAARLQGVLRLEGAARNGPPRPSYDLPLVVQLESPSGTRFSDVADSDGQFLFDGLAPGDYQLTLWSAPFPQKRRILHGPTPVRVPASGFLQHDIVITESPQ
ncbi:MAG: carboxypeptidase regulatory-like domain-containing protein [Acidobacteria bacterium]|nr:carboxypeptidase regulatory-like domain-containing protein [Acidobacteriota bacterium]